MKGVVPMPSTKEAWEYAAFYDGALAYDLLPSDLRPAPAKEEAKKSEGRDSR